MLKAFFFRDSILIETYQQAAEAKSQVTHLCNLTTQERDGGRTTSSLRLVWATEFQASSVKLY